MDYRIRFKLFLLTASDDKKAETETALSRSPDKSPDSLKI